MFLVSLGKIVTQSWNKNGIGGQSFFQMTQNVALFGKKNLGVFWRLLALKRAVSDSELLHTLKIRKIICRNEMNEIRQRNLTF